jgi:hypothetical protein
MARTMKEPWKWTHDGGIGQFIADRIIWPFTLGLIGLMLIGGVWLFTSSAFTYLAPHVVYRTKETPIMMDGNWMAGEYRSCALQATALVCPKTGDDLFDRNKLQEDGKPHIFSVRYNGTLNVKPNENVIWHCQRREESVVCNNPIDLSAGIVK